jgi:hypothetical protein
MKRLGFGLKVGNEMKPKRMLCAVASLICLLVVGFLVANWRVGSGSSATVVEVARSQCVQDGFQAQNMIPYTVYVDNGSFGLGGRATVEFCRVGLGPWGQDEPRILRVELRRHMNLCEWQALSVTPEP